MRSSVWRGLRRWRRARPSTPKIITHDTAEDEPRCANRALQRPANFGFPDAWVVAHRDFHDAKARDGAFQNHFDGPAVCSFFQREGLQHFCAGSAERAKVANAYAIQDPDQPSGEAIAERLVPRQRAGIVVAAEARAKR